MALRGSAASLTLGWNMRRFQRPAKADEAQRKPTTHPRPTRRSFIYRSQPHQNKAMRNTLFENDLRRFALRSIPFQPPWSELPLAQFWFEAGPESW